MRKGYTTIELMTVIGMPVVFIGLAYGWIVNLLALINMEPFIWSAKSIIGIGGVFFPPVGIIMGWFVW